MKVDVRSSTINWTGRKVLGKHNGTINIAKGDLTLENNVIREGRFDIDMKSIVDLDLTDAETNARALAVSAFPLSATNSRSPSAVAGGVAPGAATTPCERK